MCPASLLGRYAGLAEEKQELYQRELVQHGRTMEELSVLKDKNHTLDEELQETRQAMNAMKEEVAAAQVSDFMLLSP